MSESDFLAGAISVLSRRGGVGDSKSSPQPQLFKHPEALELPKSSPQPQLFKQPAPQPQLFKHPEALELPKSSPFIVTSDYDSLLH